MKNTRKWLVFLLCALLLVNTLSISAAAVESESPLALSVSPAAGTDSKIQVQILAAKAQTVADGKLVLTYDAEKLTYISAETGAAWGEAQPTWSPNPTDGKVILAFASAEAAAEGVLFTLTFQAAADAVITLDGSSYITGVSADLTQEINTCPSSRFIDLASLVAQYPEIHEACDFMTGNGYMNGTTASHFAPHMKLNRAMMVTILYRIAGKPPVEGAPAFTDVPEDEFYTEPVVWATANGITTGITEHLFAPNRALTRQELVTFLYRFADVMGYDRTATTDLSQYTDADQILPFAVEGFTWAVAEGIVKGTTETTLDPMAATTRAQICLMVYRLLSAQE